MRNKIHLIAILSDFFFIINNHMHLGIIIIGRVSLRSINQIFRRDDTDVIFRAWDN